MALNADLLTYLKTQSTVTSLVGSGTACRIYPDGIKEGASRPCVMYRKVSGGPMTGISGPLGLSQARYEIMSLATSRAAADTLDEAIYDALRGGNKTMGSTAVTEVYIGDADRDCGADAPIDGSDQYEYWARTAYVIWYADGD
jgi:hypothetical protein